MDTLRSFFWAGLRWCGGVGLWVVKRVVFCVVLLLVLGLLARGAHAQAGGCSMPGQVCISGNGSSSGTGVDVSVRQSGNSVPQTPSGNTMSVIVPIAVTVAAVGVAAVALPAAGAVAVTGDVMSSVGMTAIRGGIIGGVALATLMNHVGGGMSVDPNGNVMIATSGVPAGQIDPNSGGWANVSGTGTSACRDYVCTASQVCQDTLAGAAYDGWSVSRIVQNDATSGSCYAVSGSGAEYFRAYISRQQPYVPPVGTPAPATDAQIKAAIAAAPATWPEIYNDMGCPKYGNVLTNVPGGGSNDPCSVLFASPGNGFGVSFSTGGSSWTNNGCAVNSTSCPSATVTTAPTTDTQTKVNADGSKTTTTTTTTKTTTVSGTNDRTNPVEGQTTTTTSTSTTVTNPDGSTTTTTTTTTDQAPPATAGNANQQQQDKQQPTTATFAGGDWKLYTPKEKTFAQVMQNFVSRVQAMPWYTAMSGFFNVTINGGSCPHWVVPSTRFTPMLDGSPIFCGSMAMNLYMMGGVVTMLVAAWYAWRVAFL
ncbi:hypothetical protein [Ralstonia pickettii]|nr:hypothetical protein [Ralstonia pickettii]